MPAISSSYPGKIILFGEHAVVYGSYAIAIPVSQVQSKAIITALVKAASGEVEVTAPNIGVHAKLTDLGQNDPLAVAIRLSLVKLGVTTYPAFSIRITSDIPIAAGMGSGASVSSSIAKSVSTFLGRPFSPEEVSDISYEVEKLHHGNPSGVDNTVIAFNQPVFFKRPNFRQVLNAGATMYFLIADSGIKSQTADVVNMVREAKERERIRYTHLFGDIDDITVKARNAIRNGQEEIVGSLMDKNHAILQALDVSHPNLEKLAATARQSGALGAKLTGAGCGGNIITLVPPSLIEVVSSHLLEAGAVRVIQTSLHSGIRGEQADV